MASCSVVTRVGPASSSYAAPITFHFAVALATLALNGCGPELKGLRHDPSFNYSSIHAGNIGVGGVVSLVHEADDEVSFRSQMSSMLRVQLLDAQGRFNIVPTGVFANLVGAETYDETLDQYRILGAIPPETLAEWHSSAGAVSRYVVFARLEDDIVSRGSDDGQETRDNVKYNYKKLSTSRTVTVAFRVYDLESGKSVWSASLSDAKSNTTKYDRGRVKEEENQSFLESVGEAILEDLTEPEYTHPDPPELTEVVDRAFKGFAQNMPGPSKK